VAVALLALILAPFFLLEDSMNAASAWVIARERPPALAGAAMALLLAADVALPIPSSLVSTAAGALFGWLQGACISWVGMTLGCAAAWVIGRWAGLRGLRRFVGEADLAVAERLAVRYGAAAIIVARPVPVLAEASVLLAASCGMSLSRFFVHCALANASVALVYAVVGAFAMDVSSFLLAYAGAIGLPGIGFLVARTLRRR
jgi:uncharacterized membrane protein YdjX (TVP38/TMEM64 family)